VHLFQDNDPLGGSFCGGQGPQRFVSEQKTSGMQGQLAITVGPKWMMYYSYCSSQASVSVARIVVCYLVPSLMEMQAMGINLPWSAFQPVMEQGLATLSSSEDGIFMMFSSSTAFRSSGNTHFPSLLELPAISLLLVPSFKEEAERGCTLHDNLPL